MPEPICEPCRDLGNPNVKAHYHGVPKGRSHDGKAQPAMCRDHKLGRAPEWQLPKKPENVQEVNEELVEESAMEVFTPPKAGSLEIAAKGIHTSRDFANLMGALMSDLVSGTVEPETAKAVCIAGDRLLKVVEMQLKHGKPGEPLRLAGADV